VRKANRAAGCAYAAEALGGAAEGSSEHEVVTLEEREDARGMATRPDPNELDARCTELALDKQNGAELALAALDKTERRKPLQCTALSGDGGSRQRTAGTPQRAQGMGCGVRLWEHGVLQKGHSSHITHHTATKRRGAAKGRREKT
jgi:hypothetical protein